MFDSGGYYVQQGKFEISQLFSFLREFYGTNKWGDWYVLPDSPPVSSDTVDTAWGKVYETVYFAKSFAEEFNGKMEKKSIPVVQGISKEMIYYCVKNYADLNVRRIGFGKGMYDRFFEKIEPKPFVVFVELKNCFLKQLICNEYDVVGDMYITPNKILIRGEINVDRIGSRKFGCSCWSRGRFFYSKKGWEKQV